MMNHGKPITIVMADDDEDDCLLVKEAIKQSRLPNDLYFVPDGEKMMDYLFRRNKYADPALSPFPGLILLDLNMPGKDGRETLREIKSDPVFRRIPLVVLTTSQEEEDIVFSYDQGANSFITKPVTFTGLVEVMMSLGRYWFETVQLPTGRKED